MLGADRPVAVEGARLLAQVEHRRARDVDVQHDLRGDPIGRERPRRRHRLVLEQRRHVLTGGGGPWPSAGRGTGRPAPAVVGGGAGQHQGRQGREQVGPALLGRPLHTRGAVGPSLPSLEGVHPGSPGHALLRRQDRPGQGHAVVGRAGEGATRRHPLDLLPLEVRGVRLLRLDPQPGPVHAAGEVARAQAGPAGRTCASTAAAASGEQAMVRCSSTDAWCLSSVPACSIDSVKGSASWNLSASATQRSAVSCPTCQDPASSRASVRRVCAPARSARAASAASSPSWTAQDCASATSRSRTTSSDPTCAASSGDSTSLGSAGADMTHRTPVRTACQSRKCLAHSTSRRHLTFIEAPTTAGETTPAA